MQKRALITGIAGQDGSYLAELLISKGYEVHGLMRRASSFNTERIDHLSREVLGSTGHLVLHYGDLGDGTSLRNILGKVNPHEVYNLGAQSHVMVSFQVPEYTADVVGTGPLRLYDAIRDHVSNGGAPVRIYQAGSSEMFGATKPPQNETSPFYPRSPYAGAKVAAFWYGVNYREAYGMFIANGILFNHESPRRGEQFVTRKITRAIGRIKEGLQQKLLLGNLEAKRDWGFAGDYVEAMWLMLQQDVADDFVIATGEAYSVREFVELAFELAQLDWRDHVEIDPSLFRLTEVDFLQGDSRKARRQLGWEPKVSFPALVKMMVEADHELARRERTLRSHGHADRRGMAPYFGNGVRRAPSLSPEVP
jgi:GDPmannose 4,6-dehydratase